MLESSVGLSQLTFVYLIPHMGFCVGLAFSSIASSGKPGVFDTLITEKAVDSNMFSFHLTRGTSTGAELTLGGTDSSKYTGSIAYTPVTSATYVSNQWLMKAFLAYLSPLSSGKFMLQERP